MKHESASKPATVATAAWPSVAKIRAPRRPFWRRWRPRRRHPHGVLAQPQHPRPLPLQPGTQVRARRTRPRLQLLRHLRRAHHPQSPRRHGALRRRDRRADPRLRPPGRDQIVIARGGRGGRGNQHFATQHPPGPARTRAWPRRRRARDYRLELRLLADAGLVGYPNVGKSTLISRISAAPDPRSRTTPSPPSNPTSAWSPSATGRTRNPSRSPTCPASSKARISAPASASSSSATSSAPASSSTSSTSPTLRPPRPRRRL